MGFCDRYPRIIARFDRFWTGQDTDRPVMLVSAPKDSPDTAVPPPPAVDPRERWRPEHMLARARYQLATTAYHGDGFPHFFVNFGPGVLHACIGGDADFRFGDTTWWPQFLSHVEEYPKLRFQPDGKWWPRIIAVTEALLDELGDDLVVSLTDIGGAADILASAVGRQLLTDVMDRPEVVKAAIDHIHPLWIEAYERNYAVISQKQDVTTPWWPLVSRGKTYMTQCDFDALISPRLFKDLFADELGAIYKHLDNGAYHLDGIGTEGHVPTLVALEGLHCIQWVPAPGTSALRHAKMLREIQQAGVSITFNITAGEVEQACKEFDPRRLMLNVWCDTEQQAKDLVDNAPRWCQRGSGGDRVR